MSYHINAQGNPGLCKAQPGKCPFGSAADHYGSAQAAREAYERKHFSELLQSFTREGDVFALRGQKHFGALARTTSSSYAAEQYERAAAVLEEASSSKMARLQELYRVRALRAEAEELEEVAQVSHRIVASLDVLSAMRQRAAQAAKLEALAQKQLATTSPAERAANERYFKGLAKREKVVESQLQEELEDLQNEAIEPDWGVLEDPYEYHSSEPVAFAEPQDDRLWRVLGPAQELYVGRITEEERTLAQEELTRHADALLEALHITPGNTKLNPYIYYRDEAGALESNGDFELMGGGVESNVYLHHPTMMVFKVRHRRGELFDPQEESSVRKVAVLKLQQAYGSLDEEALSKLDATYSKTYFVSSARDTSPVVVQPYLDPARYHPYEPTPEEVAYMKALGLNDTHSGNVSIDTSTGKLVLFDCIIDRDRPA